LLDAEGGKAEVSASVPEFTQARAARRSEQWAVAWANVLSHSIGLGTQTTARERPPLALPQDADGNADVLARVPVEDPADGLGNEAGAVDITRALLRGDWGAALTSSA
jgi:hypothetical protein